MELGIFAKTFSRSTADEVLDAVKEAGLGCVQFNLSCAGLATIPSSVSDQLVERLNQAHRQRHLRMAALSGTTNLIHPDLKRRGEELAKLAKLVALAPRLGTDVVTLCSGTCDPEDMWRGHPDNDGPEAWRALSNALDELLPVAEAAGVALAVEPEHANVINSAAKARQLIQQMQSAALKVVFDPANLLTLDLVKNQQAILSSAWEEVEPNVVLAHAKDFDERGHVCGLGEGLLDWENYFELLSRHGFSGAVIMHGMVEAKVTQSIQHARRAWSRCQERRGKDG